MRKSVVVFLIMMLVLSGSPLAGGQPAASLPSGIISIEIDGEPIDAESAPTINSSTPEISGRVDESITSLELSVVNGETVRFAATVGGSGRFRAVSARQLADGPYTLYVNDQVVGSFTVVDGSPGPRRQGALLDIARVVPYPADVAQSLPNLGLVHGRFVTLVEEADRTAVQGTDGLSAQDIERQLAGAGWLQRYENRLALPSPGDPSRFDVQITSFVVEYASGADARTAYDSLGSTDALDLPVIGDESEITVMRGVTSDEQLEYQAARLVTRVGPLLIVIVYADLRNEPPNLDLLATLGTSVAARGGLVADRQVIPLGSMALQPDLTWAQDGASATARYENRGGALTAMFGENEQVRLAREALFAGTTDAFTSETRGTFVRSENERDRRSSGEVTASPAPHGTASPSPVADGTAASVAMRTSLFAFPSEDDAASWMTTRETELETQQDETMSFARLNDAPALADGAVVFAMTTMLPDGTELDGFRLFARAGSIVALMDVQSSPAVSLRGAIGLMEDQLACIEAQGCDRDATLPASIFGTPDRPAS